MTTRARRVLIVMPLGEPLGGGEEMFRQLLRKGRGKGIDWSVVFLRPGSLVEEARALGVGVHVVEAGRFRDVGRRLGAVRAVARIARYAEAELVFGWMVAGQATAGPAAWTAGLANAWYQVSTPRPDWLDRFSTVWPARGVITLSRDGADAQAAIWPHRRTVLVHPGVALDAVRAARTMPPRDLRARFQLPLHGPLVGTVARLQRWKGVHVFIEAVARLRATQLPLHAVIVGGPHETEPAYAGELRALAERLGVANAITFAGHQPNPLEWMQAMDVFVHTSDREPFGIVVVEAMALGKPVVAGAAGGPSDIITNGTDGLLAPYGDADAVAAAVTRYLQQPAFAQAVGTAAAQRAAAFSDVAYADAVCAAVRGFLERAA